MFRRVPALYAGAVGSSAYRRESRDRDHDREPRGDRRDYDRESRRDDRESRDRRDYDRESRGDRRDYDRESRRDDRETRDRRDRGSNHNEDDLASYDKELSRIQGSLSVLSRAAVISFNQQRSLYHSLVSYAAHIGAVVPSIKDEAAKESATKRWANYRAKTQELREEAKERRMERFNAKKATSAADEDEH